MVIKSKVSYTDSSPLISVPLILMERVPPTGLHVTFTEGNIDTVFTQKGGGQRAFPTSPVSNYLQLKSIHQDTKVAYLGVVRTDHLQKLETAGLATIILGELS